MSRQAKAVAGRRRKNSGRVGRQGKEEREEGKVWETTGYR